MTSELQILYSCDNYQVVGYFVKAHIAPGDLLEAAIDYDSDPDFIEEHLSAADVKQEYWEMDEWSDDEGDEYNRLEKYIQSNQHDGFPVTVLYLDSSFQI
ncbi:hypothetical protein [Nostoc parmelioides]|uniref:Uncharacterized protein n=1 Tax=Nostoc parmelioides FACHB-3921 TaxID=2692909 RepID=A0ABR8BPI2_9NOSO|nr:hypothetical protein [Nostoc parmelioides]MBD2255594.1 hypothetical protein [Nostoc parmelioides FACHB-3921]